MNSGIKLKNGTLLVVGLALIIWLVALFVEYIPFYAPSYFFWGGMFVGLIAVIGMVFRLRVFAIITRKLYAFGILAMVILIFGVLLWPPSIKSSTKPQQRLDDFLPRFQSSEYHEAWVDVSAEKVEKAVLAVSLTDIPAVKVLLKIRFLFSDSKLTQEAKPFLDIGPNSAFMVLDDSDPSERVYGLVGRPWEEDVELGVHTASQFIAFAKPGNIRVAFNFRVEDRGSAGTLISTETRNMGNDKTAQNIFARYWRVIYPGSSIIRKAWLNAIVRKAEEM